MARFTLVVDASIGVKWFSELDESGVPQAVDILERMGQAGNKVIVPDLFFYEVSNALAHKKTLTKEDVQNAVSNMFSIGLQIIPANLHNLSQSAKLSRKFGITVYDACYLAAAAEYDCPLVTANPRHQKPGLGCEVIPIEEWKVTGMS